MTGRYDRGHSPVYRSRNGMIFGVCKGLSEHLGVSLFWVRALAVVALCMSGGWAVGIYLIAALIMKPEPVVPFESAGDQEFYNSYVSSRSMAVQRLKRTYDNLDRRIRRIEDIVTARDYDWERRLNR